MIRRTAGMRGFLAHLLLYVGLSAVMLASGGDSFATFVMVGWGAGLLIHGAAAFGPAQYITSVSEERMLERLARRLASERP